MIQVPRGEDDPGLLAVVRVDLVHVGSCSDGRFDVVVVAAAVVDGVSAPVGRVEPSLADKQSRLVADAPGGRPAVKVVPVIARRFEVRLESVDDVADSLGI